MLSVVKASPGPGDADIVKDAVESVKVRTGRPFARAQPLDRRFIPA
jgi:hypothetical protein